MEYSLSEMKNHKDAESTEMVTKEKFIDRYRRVANAGDRKKPSETAKKNIGYMFCNALKVKISTADVENTECDQLAKHDNQVSRQPALSCSSLNKEKTSDNLSTMGLPETSLSTSSCHESPTEIEKPTNRSKFSYGAPTDISQSFIINKVPVVSAKEFSSTSPFAVANKFVTKRPATIESNTTKVKRNGSILRSDTEKTATSADADTNDLPIWEPGSEDPDDQCSRDKVDEDETGLLKQCQMVANPNNANDNCDGGQFACLDCAAVFKTKFSLNMHTVSHEGYRKYKCTVCEKRFKQSAHLTQHMRVHTGERPFECHICEKKYNSSGKLSYHKRTHTGEKPFNCDICEKRFADKRNFIRHRHNHTGEKPFTCDTCEKKFTTRGDLTAHRHVHTGKKPYQCDQCEKCFFQNMQLKRHKLTHSGEKRYTCLICGLNFGRNDNLERHKRKQHAASGLYIVRMSPNSNKKGMECSTSAQIEIQTGERKVVTKEEVNGNITLLEPSEKAKRSIDSKKIEIFPAEAENTECQQPANSDTQEPSNPALLCTIVKKAEASDILGSMVFAPEKSLSTLYYASSTLEKTVKTKTQETGKAQLSKAHEIVGEVPIDMAVSPVRSRAPAASASTLISTSPSNVGKFSIKARRLATIVANLIKTKNESSAASIESTTTARTSSAETDAIEHSIRQSGSENHDVQCSHNHGDKKETDLPAGTKPVHLQHLLCSSLQANVSTETSLREDSIIFDKV